MKNQLVAKLLASASPVIFGALIAAAPFTFAPVCPHGHGMPMACHYCARASLGIGLVLVVLGLVAFFVSPPVRGGLSIASAAVAGLELAVVTVLIGVCKNPMMHCHMMTRPVLIVFSVLALVFAAGAAWLNLRPAKTAASAAA